MYDSAIDSEQFDIGLDFDCIKSEFAKVNEFTYQRILGLAQLDGKTSGKVGSRAIMYYALTTTHAVIVSLIQVKFCINLWILI